MRGINPQKIPYFIKKDAESVEKKARIVLKISPDERTIEISENKNPRLNVIAVVGPSNGFGRSWDKVLLAEVGISQTRPYHEAKGINRAADQSNVCQRRKWFSLSPYQYQLVAPIIFRRMEKISIDRISSWKSGGPSNRFLVPSTIHWWSKGREKMKENNYVTEAAVGVRFTICLKDEFFVRDVCWAEFNLNERLKIYIEGLAKFIGLRLSYYNSRRNYKGKKRFDDLLGAKQVEKRLKECYLSRFPHLLIEVARWLRYSKRGKQFWQWVAEKINWDGKETRERQMASMATELPNPRERLGSIQLVITTGFEREKGYIVFEVQK